MTLCQLGQGFISVRAQYDSKPLILNRLVEVKIVSTFRQLLFFASELLFEIFIIEQVLAVDCQYVHLSIRTLYNQTSPALPETVEHVE